MRLFVSNLHYSITGPELFEEFTKCGDVQGCKVIMDRETGRSRGFAFIEYKTEAEARAAIQALDGYEFYGRPLVVRIAEDRRPAQPRLKAEAPQGGGAYASHPIVRANVPHGRAGGGSDSPGKKKRGGGRRRARESDYDWG